MVQMAMIPMRKRTRCQDSSSRDWSVDINVITIRPLSRPSGTLSPWRGKGIVLIPNAVLVVSGTPFPITGEGLGLGVAFSYFIPILSAKILKKNMIMMKI